MCDGFESDKKETIIKPINFKVMKTKNQISFLAIIAIMFAFVFSSCEKTDPFPKEESILPERFSVDIPGALSQDGTGKKSFAEIDTLNGNHVYAHLRFFIHVGHSGAEIVEDIIRGLAIYQINRPMSLTFTGDDDGRAKNLTVIEDVYYEGISWEFQMNITDAESEGNEDGGMAIQLFWNRNPKQGIAILKPSNIDNNTRPVFANAVYQVEYSEAGEKGYDAQMLVAVSGLPLANPLVNPYSISGMKMFVGKKGDIVDVYGNSDHPNAVFFTPQTGFSWSFVASGNDVLDIAAAEVGLPPSNLDEPSRSVLLGEYSIKNVFTNQIYNLWPNINQASVDAYLYNTEAPGFFASRGFVQGGTSPGSDYDEVEARLPLLSPYNPDEISNLDIQFKLD